MAVADVLRGRSYLAFDPDTLEPVQAPLERLFRAHDRNIRRRLAERFPHAGRDRIDDAMAHAWIQAHRFVGELVFTTADRWLFVVARNELYAIWERERRQRPTDHLTLVDLAGGVTRDVVSELAACEEAEHVLAGLIPNQRRVLVARALGFGRQEIPAAIGESQTHVDRHTYEGRTRAWSRRLEEAA